jgi:hypothetical protein
VKTRKLIGIAYLIFLASVIFQLVRNIPVVIGLITSIFGLALFLILIPIFIWLSIRIVKWAFSE